MKQKLIILAIGLVGIVLVWWLFFTTSVPPIKRLDKDAVILAFGDSLTHGTGTTQENSYPAVLSKLCNRKVINEGVPGELSSDGLERLPGLLDKHRPALLILCHGGNDFLQKKDRALTRKNVESMIKTARDRDIPVVLLGVPKASITLSPPAFYPELAATYHLPYDGDILGRILINISLKSDQVHPNEKGYRKLAEAIHNLLKQSGALE